MHPHEKLDVNWHMQLLCEELEMVSDGRVLRLIINIMPRSLKSSIVTVFWPVWVWTIDPHKSFLAISYAASLSIGHNTDRRDVIVSEKYQDYFGDVFTLKADENQKKAFSNMHHGEMQATSVGGALTGEGGDFILFDDPHSADEATSQIQRQAAIDFFRNTALSRMNNKSKGAVVVVAQRLHEYDLSGHLLKQGGYRHVSLPAIFQKKQTYIFPKSGIEKSVEAGEPLHEERDSLEVLLALKIEHGSNVWQCQYLQDPMPSEGGTVKQKWWNYYNGLPFRMDKVDDVIQSWDMAFKDLRSGSFVVGQVWVRKGANYYLLEQHRDQINFPKTIKAVEKMTAKYPKYAAILIEDKANGPAVIASLKETISGILPISVVGNKEARLAAVSPRIESGNVYLPCNCDPTEWNETPFNQRTDEMYENIYRSIWIDDYIAEHAVFPNGDKDDQVDATSQALEFLKGRSINSNNLDLSCTIKSESSKLRF